MIPNSQISTAGVSPGIPLRIWGGRNPTQYLASDPAEFYSAKERARKGRGGKIPRLNLDLRAIKPLQDF